MENFEKCTVAMLGGPCSQHVTGNTSQLNQPQSAIISYMGCQPDKLPASRVTPNKTHESSAFVIDDFILYWISICIVSIF